MTPEEWFVYALPVGLVVGYVVFLVRFPGAPAVIHVCMWTVFVAMLYLYDVRSVIEGKNEKPAQSRKAFIDKILKNIRIRFHNDHPAHFPDNIHDKPHRFVYLPKYADLCDVFRRLAFTRSFDRPGYFKTLMLMERFLKVHYKIMTQTDVEGPECMQQFGVLKDIRAALLNTMHGLLFNLPKYFRRPMHEDKEPVDKFIEKHIKYVQAFTYKKMRILSRKCDKRKQYELRFKPPWGKGHFEHDRELF